MFSLRIVQHMTGRGASLLIGVLVATGCASTAPASIVATPSLTPSIETSPTPSPPSTFTSPIYGYTVELPGGWKAIEATLAWDGTSDASSDSPEVDQWIGRTEASAWAFAAPYAGDLNAYTKQTVADNARYHGNTCPPTPEAQDPITIDGEPGELLAYDCGILINLAVTLHNGVGYRFGLRDPTIPAATDPGDAAIFAGLLGSLRLPAS
jgi:hypothetical protein